MLVIQPLDQESISQIYSVPELDCALQDTKILPDDLAAQSLQEIVKVENIDPVSDERERQPDLSN